MACTLPRCSRPDLGAILKRKELWGRLDFATSSKLPSPSSVRPTCEFVQRLPMRTLGQGERKIEPWATASHGYVIDLRQQFLSVHGPTVTARNGRLDVTARVFAPDCASLRVVPRETSSEIEISKPIFKLSDWGGKDMNSLAGEDGSHCYLMSFSIENYERLPDDIVNLWIDNGGLASLRPTATDICVPLRTDWFTVPTAQNWTRTSGDLPGPELFMRSGIASASRVCSIARSFIDLSSPITALDWGVGCGRIAVPLKRRLLPHAQDLGLDVDEFNVKWCRVNIPDVGVSVCDFYPPLDIDSDSVDLIYGCSVMTHLSRDCQIMWLRELNRVLRPGGICMLTVHGDYTTFMHSLSAISLRLLKDFGITDIEYNRQGLGPMLPLKGYYRGTFQTRRYTAETWGRFVDIIDYVPLASDRQDYVVFAKS